MRFFEIMFLILFTSHIFSWVGLAISQKLIWNYEKKIKNLTPQPEIYLIIWENHPSHVNYEKWNQYFAKFIFLSGIPLLIVGIVMASQDWTDCSGRFVDYCGY